MGIRVEFNPELALRNIAEFHNGSRQLEECIPAKLVAGKIYPFLKREQRHYWLNGQIPLVETKGGETLSRPKAVIVILETTHFVDKDVLSTKGLYRVDKVIDDDGVYFEGFDPMGKRK